MKRNKVIGITGGVGSGKTHVLNRVKETYGLPVIFADEMGHIALEPEHAPYKEVIEYFGKDILSEDGTIDRKKLAAVAFSDEVQLKKLNSIVHPYVQKLVEGKLSEYEETYKEREGKKAVVFLEAAILLESSLANLCDEIWVIYADEPVRRERLRISRGYSEEKMDQIMAAQLSFEEIKKKADHIIKNNGSEENIDTQLNLLLDSFEVLK